MKNHPKTLKNPEQKPRKNPGQAMRRRGGTQCLSSGFGRGRIYLCFLQAKGILEAYTSCGWVPEPLARHILPRVEIEGYGESTYCFL
jgi:hypothetical protein